MPLTTILIVLLILAVLAPAFGYNSWGYGSPTWGPVWPVLGVVLLVILLTRVL